ncbi:ABC transporter permease subunit [Acetobacterium paludosum]|uniref:ABC transporter permease subunit n=1 Tax=Acetobacterium paludosum TaxID=52693 RepID=A0A923HT67_9FIRM|nr:ABC transporter permease [Acetobacterium paludosum]MBC3887881.1 ABC transporter permease subunit [Acetobacterium paludosum]
MSDITKKIISSILCLAAIIIINFFLPRLMPGDPVLMLTGQNEESISAAQYQSFEEKLGINYPVSIQFKNYLVNLFSGDLGYSYHYNDTVANLMKNRIPNTLQLAIPSILLASILGMFLGCTMGYTKKQRLDKSVTTAFIIINAIPSFLLAMVIVTFFAFKLRLFPLGGLNSIVVPHHAILAFGDRIKHLILPISTIVLLSLPPKYMMVRNTVKSATKEKYVLYAKARGISSFRIKFVHIFKNVCPPFITLVGLNLAFVISGSMITEIIFSINGMGELLYEAAIYRDFPTLQGCFFIISIIVILANILTDITCVMVDPKQRFGFYESN